MKHRLLYGGCFTLNLLEGAVAVAALAVSYAFLFGADETDRSAGLGLWVMVLWLLFLLLPNLVCGLCGKYRPRDILLFQLLPLALGAAGYIAFQFTVL